MELIKDERHHYSGFTTKDGNNTLYFSNGKIDASAYSYEIGGIGYVELTTEQTYELFLAMKKFYNE